MSDELKNGDRVRMVVNHHVTGVYIGRGPLDAFPDVVRVDDIESYDAWPPGVWERIPDDPALEDQ